MGLNHFTAARDALDSFNLKNNVAMIWLLKKPLELLDLLQFPTNQTSLKLAAAFAAGSPVVLKPSEETPFAAIILAEIFDKAGVPKGVFNLVNGDGSG